MDYASLIAALTPAVDAAGSVILDIKAKGYLPAIYAHLTSLSQIERLAMLQTERAGLASSDGQVDSDSLQET